MANTVTLLPGAVLVPGKPQQILLIGDYLTLMGQEEVELQHPDGTQAGKAKVHKTFAEQFAYLSNSAFARQADPQMRSYSNAMHRLFELIHDFNIMTLVTVVDITFIGEAHGK